MGAPTVIMDQTKLPIEYTSANMWGKCAFRLAYIIRKLNPRLFYGDPSFITTPNKLISAEVLKIFLVRIVLLGVVIKLGSP